MGDATDPDNVCPFCGARVESEKALHNHVLNIHSGSTVANGRYALESYYALDPAGNPGDMLCVWCWCGAHFKRSYIGEHWREEGGLHAHLLEIALGGER